MDTNPFWFVRRLTVVPCDRGAARVSGRSDGLDAPPAGADDELKLVDQVEVEQGFDSYRDDTVADR